MRKTNKLMATILTLCMMISLLPTMSLTAFADTATNVYVGVVELTSTGTGDITYATVSDNVVTKVTDDSVPTDNYAKFENGTLTLHNFTYSGEGHTEDKTKAGIYSAGELTLVLEGTNSVTQTGNPVGDSHHTSVAVAGKEGITISGSGSLYAVAGKSSFSLGIRSDKGYVTVEGRSTVIAIGTETTYGISSGIWCYSDFTLKDTACLTAIGENNDCFSQGIVAKNQINIDGGTLTAKATGTNTDYRTAAINQVPTMTNYTGGYQWKTSESTPAWTASTEAAFTNNGDPNYVQIKPAEAINYDVYVGDTRVTSANANDILGDGTVSYTPASGTKGEDGYVPQTLTLNGATINTGIAFEDVKAGIFSKAGLTIKLKGKSTVNGANANSGFSSCGISVLGTLTIEDDLSDKTVGSLTVKGYDNSEQYGSYGIVAPTSITINSGAITSIGGNANDSCGIFSFSEIKINGGTVIATGNTQAFYDAPTFGNNYTPTVTAGESSTINSVVASPVDTTYTENKYVKIEPKPVAVDSWADVTATKDVDYAVSGDTYTIYTAMGLAWFASTVNGDNNFSGKTVTLANDINLECGLITDYDCSESNFNTKITATNSWIPIGKSFEDNNKGFQGTFDGKGHTVSGVKINDTTHGGVDKGLFGHIYNATIKNLGVINSNISATNTVGGIVAFSHDVNSSIINCYSNANVSGYQYVGGIVGASVGRLRNCYYAGIVTKLSGSTLKQFGCIAGSKQEGSPADYISNCYYLDTSVNCAVGYPNLEQDTNINVLSMNDETMKSKTLVDSLNSWVVKTKDFSYYKWQAADNQYPKFGSIATSDDFLYEISFNTNGGETTPDSIYGKAGTTITAPTAPTKKGYKFDGWYKELSINKWDFETDTVPADDITLYAKWTEKKQVVVDETTQTYTYDNTAKAFELITNEENFVIKYKVNGVYTEDAPINIGSYDVKITRAEDDTYKAYEKVITGGLVIEKAAEPNVPAGLKPVNPTTNGGNDGKITGTTDKMEYSKTSDFASKTPCTGTQITGLTAGTYYVRIAETATTKAGDYIWIVVPDGDPATVTAISINSTNHKTQYYVGDSLDVTNLTIKTTMSYGAGSTIPVTADMITGFNSSSVTESQTLTITYGGKTVTYTISVEKKAAPSAPADLTGVKPTTNGGSDGKITGTTDKMEYSTSSDFASKTTCQNTETTGLTAGTYYVRITETATTKAGDYATVTVSDGDMATVTGISVNSTNYKKQYYVGDELDVANLTIETTMSYGTGSTIPVTADMITGFNSSSVTESQTLTITYGGKTATYVISVEKKTPTYTAPTNLTATYGDALSKVTLPTGFTWESGTTTSVGNVGNNSFTVKYTPTDITNYKEITGINVSINVAQRPVNIKWTGTDNLVFDNTLKTVMAEVSNKVGTDVINLTVTGDKATAKGEYTAEVTNVDNANYTLENGTNITKDWSIADAANEWTASLDITGWTFGENANTPTATAKFGTTTFTYATEENGAYTEAVPTNAGTYFVKAEVTGTGDYSGISDTKEFTISPKAISTVISNIESVTYTGSAITPEITVKNGETSLSNTDYDVSCENNINAGTAKVKVTLKGNYSGSCEKEFTINPKQINNDVSLTAPVRNAAPQTTIETDEYTASVVWSPEVTTSFSSSTVYTATVTITAKANYTTDGIAEYTVSGATTVTVDETDNKIITAVFPKTGSSGGGGSSISYYTVKFETNGGSTVKSQSVRRNNTVSTITEPTKDGYIFDGWFTDKALTKAFDSTSKITSGITLYAKWTEIKKDEPVIDNSKNEITLTIGQKDATVFGETKQNDVAPIIRNDRTMLPARFVAEALGATVTWNNDERKVTITKDDITIIIYIDSDKAYVNGKEVTLDSPAFIENDRTYTPLRFIAENLGATVDWNETEQKVIITKK